MIGVDYASVDGNHAPDLVTAQVSFAWIRGSYETWPDPTYDRDRAAFRAADVPLGAYLFPLPGPKHPAPEVQVRKFLDHAEPDPLIDLPPALDVEFPRGVAATGLTRAELLAWIRAAVKTFRREIGIPPVIYTSKRVWDGTDVDALDADAMGAVAALDLTDCPLWLARYRLAARRSPDQHPREPWPPVPMAWGEGNLWCHQYQGDAVCVPGFSSTVDLNRFKIMAHGETGQRVRWFQRRSRLLEGTPGAFDTTMLEHVKEFQSRAELTSDGIVGIRTWRAAAWALPQA